MKALEIFIKFLVDEIKKIENKINQEEKALSYKENEIKYIETLIKKLEDGSFETNEFLEMFLNSFQSVEETKKDIILLNNYKKLKDLILDKDINLEIKTVTLKNFEIFKKKIIEIYENSYLNISLDHKLEQLKEEKQKHEKILSYFNENGINEEISPETFEELFDFLSNLPIDKKLISEIIITITSLNLNIVKEKQDIINSAIKNKIEENREEVMQILNNGEVRKQENFEIIVESTDIIKLTEEEQDLVNRVQELVNKYKETITEEDLEIVKCLTELNSTLDLESRKNLYLANDKLDWEFVCADVITNLLPKVVENKEQIFGIFEFILMQNEKEEKIQQEKAKEEIKKENTLIEIKEIIEKIKKDSEKLIKDYYSDIKNENIYKSIVELARINDNDNAALVNPNVTIVQAQYVMSVIELIDNYEIIKLLSQEEIEENLAFLKESITKCLKYKKEYEISTEIVETPTILDISAVKMLFCFLKDDSKAFAVESIENESNAESKETKYESLKNVLSLATMFEDLSKAMHINLVTKRKSNGKDENLTYRGRQVFRFKCKSCHDYGRVGYLKIPINSYVKEKLTDRLKYKYPNVESMSYNSILLIMDVIFCKRNDHDEYMLFRKTGDKGLVYIDKLISLFNGTYDSIEEVPDSIIDELENIIDDSMSIAQSILKDNKKEIGGVNDESHVRDKDFN